MQLGKRTKAKLRATIAFPRPGEAPLAFAAVPLDSQEEFEALCKRPEPPIIKRPGQPDIANSADPAYLDQALAYSVHFEDYLVLKCLQGADEPLVFETVVLTNPQTWANWTTEAEEFGLVKSEIIQLRRLVLQANALDTDLIEEATKSFRNTQTQ